MAAGTAGPVRRQGYTITIDKVLLSQSIAQPVPMPGFHKVLVYAIMAKQAGFCNFLGGVKRAFDEFRMVLLCENANTKQ
jgi:hypothetical protein